MHMPKPKAIRGPCEKYIHDICEQKHEIGKVKNNLLTEVYIKGQRKKGENGAHLA